MQALSLLKKNERYGCASAERVWPPSAARRSAAMPNGEGVASGGATLIFVWNFVGGVGGGDTLFIKKLENNNCVFSSLF